MNIAVCDDEKLFLEIFRNELSDLFDGDDVSYYDNIEELMNDIEGGKSVNILFLDIELNRDKNGIEYAENFGKQYPKMKIIYMTCYNDKFVQEIFLRNTNLVGYLMKPVNRKVAQALLEKARAAGGGTRIVIRPAGEIVTLNAEEIVSIESDRHYLDISTGNAEYRILAKLSDFLPSLPDFFAQCHKSYAVNLRHVERIKELEVLMDNGAKLPVSRSKNAEFVSLFFDYTERTADNNE